MEVSFLTVGERIKKARIEKKLTQKKLGELCKIAEPTIRRYELGKLNPKYETIQKIAKALEVTPQYLLGINLTVQSNEIPILKNTSHIYIAGSDGTHKLIDIPTNKMEKFRKIMEATMPELLEDESTEENK